MLELLAYQRHSGAADSLRQPQTPVAVEQLNWDSNWRFAAGTIFDLSGALDVARRSHLWRVAGAGCRLPDRPPARRTAAASLDLEEYNDFEFNAGTDDVATEQEPISVGEKIISSTMPVAPEFAAAIVDQSPDGIIFADAEGVIRVWNEAAGRIFGFSAEQAIGRSLDIIVPHRFRDAHWKGYDRALAERRTKHGGRALATRSQRADSTPIVVELSFAVVLGADGSALGALANAREITVRYDKERADLKRLRELEAAVSGKS